MTAIKNARRLVASRPCTALCALFAVGYALWVIYQFLNGGYFKDGKFDKGSMGFVHLAVWTVGPPIWFFFEYYVLNAGEDEARLKQVKVGQELAKNFWVAVLAVIALLAK